MEITEGHVIQPVKWEKWLTCHLSSTGMSVGHVIESAKWEKWLTCHLSSTGKSGGHVIQPSGNNTSTIFVAKFEGTQADILLP